MDIVKIWDLWVRLFGPNAGSRIKSYGSTQRVAHVGMEDKRVRTQQFDGSSEQ